MADKNIMLIGYHNHINDVIKGGERFDGPLKECGGVDFLLTHVDPHGNRTLKETCEETAYGVKRIAETGAKVIINFEGQNFFYDVKNSDGYDWANSPDGTHRLNIPQEYMDAINSAGNCMGVMYDEFEHCIINRNISIALASKYRIDAPVFPVTGDSDLLKQGSLLDTQLREYSDSLKRMGAASVSGEHVWTVLFHKFAKAGIIPNFKSQKESFSNIQFATAAGAAIEYDMPLWNCVDMWYRMTDPGHSPEEMYSNLVFAYLMGVNLCYVEAVGVFYDKKEDGTRVLNEYGKRYCDFVKEYRGKERSYDVHDYKPETGIIRYDDSFWGQGRLRFMWRNMLLGNPKIKVKKESREWVQAFNIITHGETGNGGLSWGRIELRSLLKKHRSFASMNGAVVFDDEISKDKLESLKLCFLCGVKISDETLKAVGELVRDNGLTVVSPKRFAPQNIRSQIKGSFCEIKDGSGIWIVTDNFKSNKLKKRLACFTGNKGVMTYRFGDETVKMKISPDGEKFSIIK